MEMNNYTCCLKSALPAFVVPECLGVNIHFDGHEQKQVDQIAEAGFRFVRMDFFWHSIESEQGKYIFTHYDELVEALETRDIGVIFILDYNNSYYDGGLAPHTDEGRAAFANFARASAAHFMGERVLWEIWNEPNLTQFWHPTANVEDYVKLAKTVYPALKEGDPSCTVFAPALSGWDFDFIEAAFKLGLLEATDVVSLHAYGARIPDDAAQYYSRVRKLINKYAPKGRYYPIVSGEWGYSVFGGTTLEQQADYLVRSFITNIMSGCRLSIWYDWHDDGEDPNENEHHFGTVYPDFTPKPAYRAIQVLTQWLKGYRFAAKMAAESEDDYLALFTNSMERRLVAWTSGEPHTIRIPLDVDEILAISISGEEHAIMVKDGILELELTSSPQYIVLCGISKRWEMESAWYVDAACSANSDGVNATVQSLLALPKMKGILSVTGNGIRPATEKQEHPGGAVVSKYMSTGEPYQFIKAALALEGIDAPLIRVIEIDTSACPTVEVLPPSANELLIEVKRPMAGSDGSYKGKVIIDGIENIELGSTSINFKIPTGDESVILRFPIAAQPHGMFSFGCIIKDEKGIELLRTPAKRYCILETFSDGMPGEKINKYEFKLTGDENVRADVSLTYDIAPAGAPDRICARIDYDYDEGQRYVRIAARPKLPIEGKPKSVKAWVYGNGGDSAARCHITGSDGQTFQPDFGALLSFTGWRVIEAPLTGDRAGHWGGSNDGILRYPISWDSIFLLDNFGKRKTKGTIYVGPMMVCY